jgi:hypothetical protein
MPEPVGTGLRPGGARATTATGTEIMGGRHIDVQFRRRRRAIGKCNWTASAAGTRSSLGRAGVVQREAFHRVLSHTAGESRVGPAGANLAFTDAAI